MNLPTQYLDVLSQGPSAPPIYLSGLIGPSFMAPDQGAWNDGRKRFGTLDDPDAGGYHLNQIDWDKDTGDTEVSAMEATNGGWMGKHSASPPVDCRCTGSGPCGCD